jgi:tetratricopeptide (TPR) repeat protein
MVVPFGSRSFAFMALGDTAEEQQDLESAARYFKMSLLGFQDANDDVGAAWALHDLARVAVSQGDYELARPLVAASLKRFRELGEPTAIGDTIILYGRIALAQGNYLEASQRFEEALDLFGTDNKFWVFPARILLGQAMVLQCNFDYAAAQFRAAIAIQRDVGVDNYFYPCLLGLAAIAHARGDSLCAARLLGAADCLGASTPNIGSDAVAEPMLVNPICIAAGARMNIGVDALAEQMLAAVHAHDDPVLAAAFAEGRAMSLEQAIVYALEQDD